MSKQKIQKKKGGSKKHGRNKRAVDQATSDFAKGKITFEQYKRRKGK